MRLEQPRRQERAGSQPAHAQGLHGLNAIQDDAIKK